MLRSLKDIIGYSIRTNDGDIGNVGDFYFDDEYWTVRYMVIDLGDWLHDHGVLIAPAAFSGKPVWEKRMFPVNLTMKMVKDSPDMDTDKPISRQKESELNKYFQWPLYWQEEKNGAQKPVPAILTNKKDISPQSVKKAIADSHLRSYLEIAKYNIRAVDGDIGHVEDVIIDDEHWNIRYLVVDTHILLPGGKVLVALDWIKDISWEYSTVNVGLTRKEVENSPAYDSSSAVNREYENKLYDHYGRPKYW
jgi:sporulation protein YlmC with PRC-barrel domain